MSCAWHTWSEKESRWVLPIQTDLTENVVNTYSLFAYIGYALQCQPKKTQKHTKCFFDVRSTTSSSAMAERPRELDQRFQMGGSIWGYYRLRSYFSRHCDTTQFTVTHHMVNKPFILLGLAAEYRSRRRRRRCANNIAADHQCWEHCPTK